MKQEHEKTQGHERSPEWPRVRAEFLSHNPTCAVCGGSKKLEVHHKLPFHLDNTEELNKDNLITLCENKKDGINCHLAFGHLGSFRSFNKNVVIDAHEWNVKITSRP